jgi:hypothetical protein
MYKLILSISLFTFSSWSFAEMSFEQELKSNCAKVKQHAQLGKKFYDQKQYSKAIDSFKQQAAWSAFCDMHHEDTGIKFSEQAISTAYNNVGLSYAKLGKTEWARAWFSVYPDTKNSQFNLQQLAAPKKSATLAGTYVQHAGFGEWNTITVKRNQNAYKIEFNGFYMGIQSLIYGPNIGEFETQMPFNKNHTEFRLDDCLINLKFGFNAKQGQYIQADTKNMMSCGFGHNVSAYGMFLKVE